METQDDAIALMADAGTFLALPPEVNDLKARIAQYQGALRFQQR